VNQTAARIRGSQYAPFRSQIIRAALSIPANIVEGREQKNDAGFARFLRIALGSASELEYHLTAAAFSWRRQLSSSVSAKAIGGSDREPAPLERLQKRRGPLSRPSSSV
jgi:four helix bundle protein